MNPRSVICKRQEDSISGGMLLSPTDALTTMTLVPLAAFVLVLLAMSVPLQNSFGSNRTLDFSLFPDGSAHIFYELESDPLFPDTIVTLFGSSIENLVVEDENGFLLSAETYQNNPNIFEIETLGASTILINYDTYSLVSKNGKVWTFAINAPTEFSLLMPKNSLVVGMTTFPIDMNEEDSRTKMLLPPGSVELTYFLTIAESAQENPIVQTEDSPQSSIIIAIGGIIAAAIIGIIFKFRKKSIKITPEQLSEKTEETEEQFNLENVLADENVRDDDKEIIKFIHENGGQVFESDLRKKFLQPRTTMWRAVKRLERQGKIVISKKDQQNLIKLQKQEEEHE